MGRVLLMWKYGDDPGAMPEEEKRPDWVTRSFAEQHARENDYEFFADDPR